MTGNEKALVIVTIVLIIIIIAALIGPLAVMAVCFVLSLLFMVL